MPSRTSCTSMPNSLPSCRRTSRTSYICTRHSRLPARVKRSEAMEFGDLKWAPAGKLTVVRHQTDHEHWLYIYKTPDPVWFEAWEYTYITDATKPPIQRRIDLAALCCWLIEFEPA